MAWIAEIRSDYFENARGKFIKTEYENVEFNDIEELENVCRNYELAADVDNNNCDVKIMKVYEVK